MICNHLGMIHTVFHAFGLMARNVLIATLERRAPRKSIEAKLFLKEKLKIFPSKITSPLKNSFLHAFFFVEKKQCV